MRFLPFLLAGAASALLVSGSPAGAAELPSTEQPLFSRHVTAVFSRLGCNAGGCHGAVQGKNGFRLSLFGADPQQDHAEIVQGAFGRRIDRQNYPRSLLLLKATAQIPHGGGQAMRLASPEYELVSRWLAAGAPLDDVQQSALTSLVLSPARHELLPGETASLQATARFADGSQEDVTWLCVFESRDEGVATVSEQGTVQAQAAGDAAIVARFRAAPAVARALVARPDIAPFPHRAPHNFIDAHILAKLQRLNIHPAELTDDAAFLRRVRLDVTGQLPTAQEVRQFLADPAPDKRLQKIDGLLAEPGYAALWTLKFCDLLRAADYGVYADNLGEQYEAPRFQAWIRARLTENTPYDELAARIVGATSRDGRSLEEYAQELIDLQTGYGTPRQDLSRYAQRHTLDIYWQRREATGLPGALQTAHAFLGLRMGCAQCHRHPHDIWQQDDLLSFANFFMRVRTAGFQGDNETKFPEEARLFQQYTVEGKQLAEQAKQLREGELLPLAAEAEPARQLLAQLEAAARQFQDQAGQAEDQARRQQAAAADLPPGEDRLRQEQEAAVLLEQAVQARAAAEEQRREADVPRDLVARHDALAQRVQEMERRGRILSEEVAVRLLHAQVFHRTDEGAAGLFASVTSPLGSQSSTQFRLLGASQPLEISPATDPRQALVEWLRRPDNPYFAKAIVNRVWAHYFGRGIIDPPDDLSPFNPPSHPELLDELCRRFVAEGYDLRWLHRTILASRTYQQTSLATSANHMDTANYSRFYLRRLPAEVLLDALDRATGTREEMDMQYYHWPAGLTAVELPYKPQNGFVTFVLEQFGRPQRNSASQCDCERQGSPSLLQILSLANHPRVRQKIADPAGRAARLAAEVADPAQQIEDLFLAALGRLPTPEESAACLAHRAEAETAEIGLQEVLWGLFNTKEFILQH